jgi:Fe-S cluster assembly iron-binding protein IscA
MLIVTERAASELLDMLELSGAQPPEAIRLQPDPSGRIGITIAPPEADDEIVQQGDTVVLVIAAPLVPVLDGAILDVETIEEGGELQQHFTLRRAEA